MMYFLDSNVIIDLIDGNSNVLENLKKNYQEDENSVKIPDLVYYEVLRGCRYKKVQKKEQVFIRFCRHFGIVRTSLKTREIAADNYARLLHDGIPLSDDDDILIGSRAVEHEAILVTSNTKHLGRIDGIKLEDWTRD